MGQPEIKILSCRGISPSAEGRSMLNTRRTRMPKRKNDTRTGADDAQAIGRSVGLSGNIQYGIRGYEERVIGHNDRQTFAGRTNFLRISRAGSAASCTCCDTTADTLASLERGKFTILAIKSSLNHYVDP